MPSKRRASNNVSNVLMIYFTSTDTACKMIQTHTHTHTNTWMPKQNKTKRNKVTKRGTHSRATTRMPLLNILNGQIIDAHTHTKLWSFDFFPLLFFRFQYSDSFGAIVSVFDLECLCLKMGSSFQQNNKIYNHIYLNRNGNDMVGFAAFFRAIIEISEFLMGNVSHAFLSCFVCGI